MNKIEWRGGHDMSDWGPGPWQDEPSKIQWIDEATDLDCLMVRNRWGCWCGYVGVAPGHRFYDITYRALEDAGEDISAHGGLTYSDRCQEAEDVDDIRLVCHTPYPGRSPEIWWFGFDCGHSMDLMPGMRAMLGDYGIVDTYRDVAYVRAEVERLARQLA